MTNPFEKAGLWPDRRAFMGVTAMGLLSACATVPQRNMGLPTAMSARLTALLDRIFEEQLDQKPESVTSLGIDKGQRATARTQLNDQSRGFAEQMIAKRAQWLAALGDIDRDALDHDEVVTLDCLVYDLTRAQDGAKRFSFGRSGFPSPYVLTQINGAYQSIPDFLTSQHSIETREDAESYLARLHAFAQVMNDETDRARADGAAGVVPPDFIIEKSLQQMRALRAGPTEKTPLVRSLVDRARAAGIDGDWAARAAAIVDGPVWTAVDRQISLLETWRKDATHDAGVGRLPQGADYYAFATRFQTTTTMSPEEIHTLGLELVRELSADADAQFKSLGLSHGSVGERFVALYKDPRFIYPNDDTGRAELLDYLNILVRKLNARLPDYFKTLPKSGLEVRRVPVATEAGAPGGSYQDGSLDGSRPGIYYINLRDTAETPRWALPTLTVHEGIPGHHLQAALTLEAPNLPMIRRTMWFTAYGEGWALYSEQLADEMGIYADDPWGRLGYLHDAIFRAVRLVLDSGLHAKGWSRERAIAYYMEQMGDPETVAATEVERYCVWPGQACSYMIGKVMWLKLRKRAEQRLGSRFDIRTFHDAGLLAGPMPLEILENEIDRWIDTY
jgi:uncharacterized protein (DUF885 family)